MSLFESPYSPLFFPTTPPSLKKRIAERRNCSCSGFQDNAGKPSNSDHSLAANAHHLPQAQVPKAPTPSSNTPLLSPFVSSAQPSRHVYVDDCTDEEGEYAALVRLAAATPIASSTTGGTHGAMVVPNSSVAVKRHNTPIVIHDSDSEEFIVSDIELNDEILKLLDTPVRPTAIVLASSTTGGTRGIRAAPSSSMVVGRRSSPISVHGSDSEEYMVSDIELNDNILRLLDESA